MKIHQVIPSQSHVHPTKIHGPRIDEQNNRADPEDLIFTLEHVQISTFRKEIQSFHRSFAVCIPWKIANLLADSGLSHDVSQWKSRQKSAN
ncbi:MAG: hypothetical protein KA239_03625, partial [Bacteroidia bacterium]|nr:hypothetical protein [Bacteroidia bacterium]